MKFWDASAIVPLMLEGQGPEFASVNQVIRADPAITVWWGTIVECVSALVRKERTGEITATVVQGAGERLRRLCQVAGEVAPTPAVRERAERILRLHALRAADALQLAAALAAAQEHPKGVGFVCLDRRLREAAAREGFTVLP